MIQYFYRYGIDVGGLNLHIGEDNNKCNQILLEAIETQEYKEQVLDVMYDFVDFSYEPIEELVLSIIDNMQPKKREKFLQCHNFNSRMIVKLYNKYNSEGLIQKSDSSMEEYLASSESYPAIIGVNKRQAKKLLELYGDTMYSVNLSECVKNSSDNVGDLENMLSKYYERIKGEINSIFMTKTLWSYHYQNLEMFIGKFSKDIDERTLERVLENYNESLKRAEEKIKKYEDEEDKIEDFIEHDKENPQFLYDIVCKYYDTKIQDENFMPKRINFIITKLPLMDRLQFVRRYGGSITKLEISGISKEVIGTENLDLKRFLAQYQDLISTQDIIDIINSVPFKQRIELIKVCNLDEEQKKEIIQYAQKNGEQNVSFLELAATKAKLKENNVDKAIQPDESRKIFFNGDIRE